ncbi:MAG: hypothetical protein HY775_05325 [Acidobacteria bacterium]|nr:hypothetical protein [Acidobacteriota bacterium]
MPAGISGYASVALIEGGLTHLDRSFTYAVPEGMRLEPGAVVRVPFRRKRRVGVVVGLLAEPDVSSPLPVACALGPGIGADLFDLCAWTAEQYLSTLGEGLAAAVPDRVAEEEGSGPGAPRELPAHPPLAWAAAYRGGSALSRAAETGGGAFLWRPAVGESRGEAVASLVAAALARGSGAIVMVPEVRVAGATGAAIEALLGDRVAWLGSDRPARARYREWLALRSGAKTVAVGGRSAVLAPVARLGLVVIDDEGHASYKERRAPRIHARTVAAERARRCGATLVLVGAPPSIEARTAADRRALQLVAPARADEIRARPPVSVIDPGEDRLAPSGRVLSLARDALSGGRRVVLLAHRAGDEGRRIAARATRVLGARRPAALDAKSSPEVLRSAVASSDVIVATPVLAKDLELAGVGIVAIVGADAALASPDFRAAEEAFATWWHVGRWVTRAGGGRIAIETRDPTHPAVRALARWDPDVLWRAEAARRSELGYPPFGALVRIEPPPAEAARIAAETAAALEGVPGGRLLGPLDREGRSVLLAKAPSRAALVGAMRPLVAAWREAGERVRVDVDPREVLP